MPEEAPQIIDPEKTYVLKGDEIIKVGEHAAHGVYNNGIKKTMNKIFVSVAVALVIALGSTAITYLIDHSTVARHDEEIKELRVCQMKQIESIARIDEKNTTILELLKELINKGR